MGGRGKSAEVVEIFLKIQPNTVKYSTVQCSIEWYSTVKLREKINTQHLKQKNIKRREKEEKKEKWNKKQK